MSIIDTITTSATQAVGQASAIGSTLSTTFQQGVGAAQAGVQDLAGKLSAAGMSMQNAVQGGIKAVTDKFAPTFTSLSKGSLPKSPSPTEQREAAVSNKADHVFPSDIGDYFMLFSFYQYERPSATETPKEAKTMSVALPLPQNLSESFNMLYDSVEIGQLATIAQNAGQSGIGKAFEGMNIKEVGKALLGNKTATGKAVGKDFAQDASNAAQQSGGFAPNPHIGLLFKGVNLRAPHQFTYRLSPKNVSESIKIREIIRSLKYVMHPARAGGSLNFNYPDLCNIKIKRPAGEDYDLYTFKPCFLESMNVNYSPNGVPTFFAGTRHPTDIEITMVFKEAQIFTRDDFSKRV